MDRDSAFEQMTADVQALADRFPGKVAVRLRLPHRLFFDRHADEQVVSASMIKVPILLCLEHTLKEKNISPQQKIPVTEKDILDDSMIFDNGPRDASLYELAYWMITYSDNTSTNVLIDYLGFDRLNRFFAEHGLTCTSCQRKMLDFDAVAAGRNNYISPDDYYTAFHRLSPEGLNLLRQNRDSDALLRYIYEGPVLYHKTGELDDIAHDAGVFVYGDLQYELGVFVSEFDPKEHSSEDARRLIGRISRRVFDFVK